MKLDDQEALRAALVELEQLNTVAEKSRANAEMLLRGLERLSNVSSGGDALTSVLSMLSSSVDDAVLCVLVEDDDALARCIASTDPKLLHISGTPQKALTRAFGGKSAILANSIAARWWDGFGAAFCDFGSALLHPIAPLEKKAVFVGLSQETGAFSKDHLQRLRFFVPLAIQGMRQSESMAEVEAARQAAEKHAKTDFLTGLSNRLALEEHAQSLTADSQNAETLWAALVDLNAFKPINDNFGHDAGDAVLVEIGKRLSHDLGPRFVAARLGGDEFGLLLPNVKDREDVSERGKKIVRCFEAPIIYGDNEFHVGASIGLAPLGPAEDGLDGAMIAADQAMYSMKARRVTGFAIYDATKINKGDAICAAKHLKAGLQDDQFVAFYQPKIDLATGHTIGFEALARWLHPTAGIMYPGKFLKPIEDGGFANKFTRSIVLNVIDQLNAWKAAGFVPPPVAINLSEVYLAVEDGVSDLVWLLEEHNISSDEVVFEITEDVLIARSSDTITRSIGRLKDWGGRISLDDFGTGYSSLRHLTETPLDEIKIDKTFVDGLGTDPASDVIIDAILSMAKGLGLNVVAEGIETQTQLNFLIKRGCPEGQGFYFSQAVSAEEAEAWLERSQPAKRFVS